MIAIVGIAGTGPVLRAITPWLNTTVAEAIEGDFELGRIEDSLWTGLSLDRLSMSMPSNGLAVEVSQFGFDWSPLALLGGTLRIDRVESAAIDVVLPDMSGTEDAAEEEETVSGGFAPPLAIELGKLALGNVHISDPASGKSFEYGLSASAAIRENLEAALSLDLQPLDDSIDHLKADIDFDGDEPCRAGTRRCAKCHDQP